MLDGHKDSGSIAAEIKMMRMVHEGAILIVEGVNDVRFWSTRQHDTCELVDGEGKGTVVGAVHQLDAENFRGVLGVVDDDYDSLMGISPGTRNLIATDTHDLECLLCRSSALETVLTEFGVASKVKRFEEAAGDDVRTGSSRSRDSFRTLAMGSHAPRPEHRFQCHSCSTICRYRNVDS